MTTWTLDQIGVIEGLCAHNVLDLRTVQALTSAGLMTGQKRALREELRRAAHVYAVEIDIADVDLEEHDREETSERIITARWRPATRMVELHGGPHDGSLLEVEDVHLPMPVDGGSPSVVSDVTREEDDGRPIVFHRGRYDLAGWRERERRWVMAWTSA